MKLLLAIATSMILLSCSTISENDVHRDSMGGQTYYIHKVQYDTIWQAAISATAVRERLVTEKEQGVIKISINDSDKQRVLAIYIEPTLATAEKYTLVIKSRGNFDNDLRNGDSTQQVANAIYQQLKATSPDLLFYSL